MDSGPGTAPVSAGKAIGIAFVVAVIFGAISGFVAGSLANPARTPSPTPEHREFWVFTVVLPFNDTYTGVPHDYFAPDKLIVNLNDNITIHYFNTEEEPEEHTFTIFGPYNIDVILPYNETTTFSFDAKWAGIFPYVCTIHVPTMTGYLIVND